MTGEQRSMAIRTMQILAEMWCEQNGIAAVVYVMERGSRNERS